MNYDGCVIELPGWAKFNPRGNEKKEHHHHWFRLEDNLLSDPQFADFGATDICVLIYILATTCQKQGQPWKLNLNFASTHARVKITEFKSALDKLLELNIVRLNEINRTTNSKVSSTHNITVHNITDITEQNKTEDPSGGRISDEIRPPVEISENLVPVKTELPARAKRGRPPKAPDPSGEAVGKVIAAYVTAFQTRYGKQTRPELGGKTRGLIGTLLKQTPLERLCLLVQAYCQMDDKWFATKAHDFPTFYENIGKVGVALDLGRNDPAKRGWRELLADQEAAKAKRLEAGVA